jgi:hypothetical protein
MVTIADSMMRTETKQRRSHSIKRGREIGGIEVRNGYGQMVAMMKFGFREQTTLQAVDESQNCGVVHFLSK